MELFREARTARFGHDHPAVEALRACASGIEALLPRSLPGAVVRPSVGQAATGRRSLVIAVLHPDVTTTTQHGVYPVLLFREDLAAVEVTIAQGVTDLKKSLGRRAAVHELDRERLLFGETSKTSEKLFGFHLDAGLELGPSQLARDYVASTVVHRRYEQASITESDVSGATTSLLEAYGRLLQTGTLRRVATPGQEQMSAQALMIYVGQSADANFESGGRAGWWGWKQAPSGLEALRPGHLVGFGRGFNGGSPRVDLSAWQTHDLHEVVVGRVTQPPERTDGPGVDAGRARRVTPRIRGSSGSRSSVPRREFRSRRATGSARRRARRCVGARSTVGLGASSESRAHPCWRISWPNQTLQVRLRRTRSECVRRVPVRHRRERPPPRSERRTAFLAAVATKPFAILTGQSGVLERRNLL